MLQWIKLMNEHNELVNDLIAVTTIHRNEIKTLSKCYWPFSVHALNIHCKLLVRSKSDAMMQNKSAQNINGFRIAFVLLLVWIVIHRKLFCHYTSSAHSLRVREREWELDTHTAHERRQATTEHSFEGRSFKLFRLLICKEILTSFRLH